VYPLKQGRASTVTDLGDGRVLRVGGNPAREAEIMRHAAVHGFPVPEVYEVRDDALVLELVDGPDMLDALRRRPWTYRAQMRALADLHARLHEIPYGDARLVHLDLHPENVMLSSRGPVVLDWTNARAGDPAVDRALVYVIAMTSGGRLGRVCARAFARYADVRTGFDEAVAYRLADPNVTEAERAAVRRLLPPRAARRAARSRG
jgi:tRNA A-37 threonylcarbamoyl transferase component Bud32